MLFNFYFGTNICHRNYLKRHDEDAKHKAAIARYILNQYPSTPAQLEECVKRAKYQMPVEKKNGFNILFDSNYWIAKEGLAFAKFASLCKLQAKNGLSTGENYINIMGCRMFIKAISETLQESTSVDMKNCRFLTYFSDGSTDAGIREQEIVYCRYVKKGNPVTKFLGIQHLEHAHADVTLAAIEKVVCNHLDNTNTMYQKGVNCKFEAASVMSGCQGGARTKMQEKQPAMTFPHCTAHKLELAVLDTVKSDTNLEKLQSTLSAMLLCYYYSPKKRREIQEISSFLNKTFRQFDCLKMFVGLLQEIALYQ